MTKKEIMAHAWRMYRETNANEFLFSMTFGECLKAAWNTAKYFDDLSKE